MGTIAKKIRLSPPKIAIRKAKVHLNVNFKLDKSEEATNPTTTSSRTCERT